MHWTGINTYALHVYMKINARTKTRSHNDKIRATRGHYSGSR